MSKLLELSGAKAIITTPALAEAMEAAGGGRPLVLTGADAEAGVGGAHLSLQKLLATKNREKKANENPPPEAVAVLPFSAGTTGLPKGVVLTHRNLVASLCSLNHPDAMPSFENNSVFHFSFNFMIADLYVH
jgi:long-subunit acyl-CoA synthetase (AMP-forming)